MRIFVRLKLKHLKTLQSKSCFTWNALKSNANSSEPFQVFATNQVNALVGFQIRSSLPVDQTAQWIGSSRNLDAGCFAITTFPPGKHLCFFMSITRYTSKIQDFEPPSPTRNVTTYSQGLLLSLPAKRARKVLGDYWRLLSRPLP